MSDGVVVTEEQARAAYDEIPWQTFGTEMCRNAKAAIERGDWEKALFYSEWCQDLLDKWKYEY
jgi:hypothetical protein